MNLSKKVAAVVVVLSGFLSGCVSPPTQEDLSKIDYGSYPNDYKKTVERYLDMTLKDPGSKQIEWLREPRTMWNKAGPMFGGGLTSGYAVCAYVNARNSYGGYTGSKLSWFLIKNERVIQAYISTTRDSFETMQAERACSM